MNRQQMLEQLRTTPHTFDVIVIGGGITGAGVAREAAGSGLKTLLVEQKDFAWGTSSRSSKMVHGGLRYLASGHFGLTRDALRERERLMREAPGLVEPLPFLMPHYKGAFPGPRVFQSLLRLYDRLAGIRSRGLLTAAETGQWAPGLNSKHLLATSRFTDAVTDDARLVQRLIREARLAGAWCLNYVAADTLERDQDGRVTGVRLRPETGLEGSGDKPELTVHCPHIINATGVWADRLQKQVNTSSHLTLRPLRGSHLVIPWHKLPVTCAVSLMHPSDKRPVFAFPWAGATVLGTTDLEHTRDLNQEPAITSAEVDYLLQIAGHLFPTAGIEQRDILSTWAGVRPVVTDGSSKTPSRENREHAVCADHGLISIAGGKLTTFRPMARQALTLALGERAADKLRADNAPVFTPGPASARPKGLPAITWQRLQGYYGADLPALLAQAGTYTVANTSVLWAEITWACQQEQVEHLDDLMLRRTRLGLVLPNGGCEALSHIRERCQALLGWSDRRWDQEQARYLTLHRQAYQLPAAGFQPGGAVRG